MILYMKSSTFIDDFIENEDDVDILTATYVCVSTNIRRREESADLDIIIATRTDLLYPSNQVYISDTLESTKDAYFEQLRTNCLPCLAAMIKKSIKKGKNIILICSDSEWKIPYLKWVSEFVYDYFDYPIYSYKDFVSIEKLKEVDEKKVLKKVITILDLAKKHNLSKLNDKQKERVCKNMKKHELKELLKDKGLYRKNMSRSEMIDMLEAFL